MGLLGEDNYGDMGLSGWQQVCQDRKLIEMGNSPWHNGLGLRDTARTASWHESW